MIICEFVFLDLLEIQVIVLIFLEAYDLLLIDFLFLPLNPQQIVKMIVIQ